MCMVSIVVVLEESIRLSGHPAYSFAPNGVGLTKLEVCEVSVWLDVLPQCYRVCLKLLLKNCVVTLTLLEVLMRMLSP